jgi:hypothetical protein
MEYTVETRPVETPYDQGDLLAAAAMQLDQLQARCSEALELAKKAQAQVVATQQVLSQHIARMRGLLVATGNARKAGAVTA